MNTWKKVEGGLECGACEGVVVATPEEAAEHDTRWHSES